MKFDEFVQEYNLQALDENHYYYLHLDWNYADALSFQDKAIEVIRRNRSKQLFILTSHPHVFTMGRGLQRDAKQKGFDLQDLTEEQKSLLPFPLYPISRGGGLTFHYPGQLVVYPIVNLNGKSLKLGHIVYGLLELAKRCLQDYYSIKDLTHQHDLLGLWLAHQKIASAGVGLKHFVNHHGMAINILRDDKMLAALQKVAPCGLSANSYTFLADHTEARENLLQEFTEHFIENLKKHYHHCWVKEFWRERE